MALIPRSWFASLRNSNRKRARLLKKADSRRRLLVESLELRALLAATVATDLPDYRPGSTAYITAQNNDEPGLNFTAGETIHFQVTRTDGIEDFPNGNLPWQVTDGVGGFDPYVNEDGI